MSNQQDIYVAFTLGLLTAEKVHGISRTGKGQETADSIFETLGQIADGDITLMNTPEESIAGFPEPSEILKKHMPEEVQRLRDEFAARVPGEIREAILQQKAMAAKLLEIMRQQ